MTKPSSYAKPGNQGKNPYITLLLYGHPGAGKTVFFGSGGEDVLIISSDPDGTISPRSLGFNFHEVSCRNYDDFDEIHDWLKGDKPTDFRWVVWDSLTLFQDMALFDDIMVDAVVRNPNQDPSVPSQREYLQNMNNVRSCVRKLVNLPYNVGITCLAEKYTDEDGGDGKKWMPMIQGKKMPKTVSAYFNMVGLIAIEKGPDKKKRQVIHFLNSPKFMAKDRYNACVPLLEKPTLPKLEEAVRAKARKTTTRKATAK